VSLRVVRAFDDKLSKNPRTRSSKESACAGDVRDVVATNAEASRLESFFMSVILSWMQSISVSRLRARVRLIPKSSHFFATVGLFSAPGCLRPEGPLKRIAPAHFGPEHLGHPGVAAV
jgi:hypothetical protein